MSESIVYWYTGWPRRYRKYILQITQPSQYGYAKLKYRFAVISGSPSNRSMEFNISHILFLLLILNILRTTQLDIVRSWLINFLKSLLYKVNLKNMRLYVMTQNYRHIFSDWPESRGYCIHRSVHKMERRQSLGKLLLLVLKWLNINT